MFRNRLKNRIEYFNRYRTILQVMLKYGFGRIVEKLNLEHYFEHGINILSRNRYEKEESIKLKGSERLRLVFEELGPTFIKIGQILSTRPDIISLEYISELKKLQDKVEPLPFAKIKGVLEKAFDGRAKELFAFIDEKPIGSASIAQVHKAILQTGETVVLKIKKPEVDHIIEMDIEILYNIATLIENRISEFAYYNPVKMVDEFSKTLKKELDFTREAKNNEIVRLNFRGESNFRVPKIFWDYTNNNVLTMEFIDAEKLSDLLRLDYENKKLATLGANIFLKQIFEDGFFHADPHPGNMFVEDERTLIFIDYGMVGVLDEKDQENMAEILSGVITKDVSKVITGFKSFNTFPEDLNEKSLRAEIKELIEKYHSLALKSINIGQLIDEISQIIIKYKVTIPPDFFLIGKTLMTIDGTARVLDPDFDMIEVAKPFMEKLLLRKYSFKKIFKLLKKDAEVYRDLFEKGPAQILAILEKLRDSKLSVEVKSGDLQNFSKTIDRVMNRVTTAIIVAALIVGSSMLIQSKEGIMIKGYSVLGISGFVIAGIFGVIIMIDMIKKS